MRLLQAHGGLYFPRTAEIRFDAATVWFVSALGISSALLFGLVPAIQATAGLAPGALRSTRTVAGGMRARWLRRAIVAVQFAIATPLLIVAALLLTSLDRLKAVDLGFDTTRVLTGSIRLPSAQYRDGDHVRLFWDELKRRVEMLPGVTSVAFADGLPPNNVDNSNNFDLEQYPTPAGESQPVTPWVAVTPDYVQTLGLTLLEGACSRSVIRSRRTFFPSWSTAPGPAASFRTRALSASGSAKADARRARGRPWLA
jgi:putative ABC transport system permease protein